MDEEIPVLLTERLRLRAFRADDLDAYAALNSDPEVLRFLVGAGLEPWDRGRAFRHMAYLLGSWRLKGTGAWAVELRDTGVFTGVIGFSEPQGWPGFELAWTLARSFWGHGYATEGARAALDHAFTTWRREHVISLIHPENRASIRVAERLGQRLEGRTEVLGREMLCYGIDRSAARRPRWGPGRGPCCAGDGALPARHETGCDWAQIVAPGFEPVTRA